MVTEQWMSVAREQTMAAEVEDATTMVTEQWMNAG